MTTKPGPGIELPQLKANCNKKFEREFCMCLESVFLFLFIFGETATDYCITGYYNKIITTAKGKNIK